jgi:hypothetical protein
VTTFSFSGANIGRNFSTPTIPLLANFDNDVLATPEFFIFRGDEAAAPNNISAVMLNASGWYGHESFDTGGTDGYFISTPKTDGLMMFSYNKNGVLADNLDGVAYQPSLIDVDGDSVYELLFTLFYKHADYYPGAFPCYSHTTIIGVLSLDGSPAWVNQLTDSCPNPSFDSGYTILATQPVIGDFSSQNPGSEICYTYCAGNALGSSFKTCNENPTFGRRCDNLAGNSFGTSGVIATFRNDTYNLGDATITSTSVAGTWAYGVESTAANLDGTGTLEYIAGIAVFKNVAESNTTTILSALDLGLGQDNNKAPLPVLDQNSRVQLLYSDTTSNDFSGTKYYTIGGAAPPSENSPPTITSIVATPASRTVAIGQPVQFVISGTDPESDQLYTAKRCKVSDSASSFTATNTQVCTYTAAGSYTARLYLTDLAHITSYAEYQDLQVNVTTSSVYCGNGVCETNESITTCPSDCTTGGTGSTERYQIDLQTDLVNVNAPFGDASQQGLLGNLYLGATEFFSKILLPVFAVFICVLVLLTALLIVDKIKAHF